MHQEKRQTSTLSFFYVWLSKHLKIHHIKLEDYLPAVLTVSKTVHATSWTWTTSVWVLLFFFLLQLTIFATMWKCLQPGGAPCSTAWRTDGEAEQRWPPGKKKKKKKKKRDSHTETHTEIRQNTAHRVPVREMRRECVSECVFMSGELCLCVYLSKLCACSGVCDEAN